MTRFPTFVWFLLAIGGLLCAQQDTDKPVSGERSGLDDLRSELAAQLLLELEAHAEEGDLEAARLLLWGIWAQSKRDRYWAKKRLRPRTRQLSDRLAAIDTSYARARDACYGSFPQLEDDDDEVDIASQLTAAEVGLKHGDLGTAYSVLGHLKTRRAAGLAVSQELVQRAQALVVAYREKNTTANATLRNQGSTLISQDLLRGERTVEQRFHKLFELQERLEGVDGSLLAIDRQSLRLMQDLASIYLGLVEDMTAAREALVAFAALAPDPEWIDAAFAGFIAADASKQNAWASFLGVVRAGSLGAAVLAELELPARISRVYLAYADACLNKAEKAYQADRFEAGAAQLAEAASGGLANVRNLGGLEEELRSREERIEQLKTSASLGKLRRADSCLAAAEAALALVLENPHELDRALRQLEACQGWLAGAQAEGVETGAVEQRRDQVRASVAAKLVELAEAARVLAEQALREAEEHLADGGDAWRATSDLETCERKLQIAEDYLARLSAAGSAAAAQQAAIAGARQKAASLAGQVVRSQTLPADAYQGARGASWRSQFSALLRSEREWEVLGLTIANQDWVDKTAEYEYWSGPNTKTIETRWYRHLFVWAAVANPEQPEMVDLRYLGFRLHKMTDGSYAKLKLYWVEEPLPMLRANLPE